MLLSPRQRTALRNELGDLLFRVTAGGGALLGLVWALQRPTPEAEASCRGAAERIGECMADGIVATALPYILATAAGGFAGAVLGVILMRCLLPRRSPGGSGRWITARFAGACRSCRASIAPGDRIRHSPGRTLCQSCGS